MSKNISAAKEALSILDHTLDRLKFIHLPVLKGLLYSKLSSAQNKGIDVVLDIPKPVDNIPLDIILLCRIVGNIVDNAIEELLSEDYTHKHLNFGILIEDNNNILIICGNTCTTPPNIDEIFDETYTTKKGINRGPCLYPNSDFFECHKSFVVNLNNLTELCKDNLEKDKGYMTMSNGSRCYVSSRKRNKLLKLIATTPIPQPTL